MVWCLGQGSAIFCKKNSFFAGEIEGTTPQSTIYPAKTQVFDILLHFNEKGTQL